MKAYEISINICREREISNIEKRNTIFEKVIFFTNSFNRYDEKYEVFPSNDPLVADKIFGEETC